MQTSITVLPLPGLEGQVADSMPREQTSHHADGAIKPGRLVLTAADDTVGLPAPLPSDNDAIMEELATLGAAGSQTFIGADLDGLLGSSDLYPARQVTITLASEADWNATVALVSGISEDGRYIDLPYDLPNNGNSVVYSRAAVQGAPVFFRKVLSVTIPAQGGDAVGRVGVDASLGSFKNAGVAVLNQFQDDTNFADGDMLSVLRKGRIWVKPENAVSVGDSAFARFLVAGETELGAFRGGNPGGTGSAPQGVKVEGAKFVTSASAGEPAMLEVDFIGAS